MSKLYRHHKIPQCMGGPDDPPNIEYLTYPEHVEAHRLLCEKYPDNFKLRFAYLNMKNLSEQAHKEATSRGGKISAENGGPAKGGAIGGKIGGKITGTKNLLNWCRNNPDHWKKLGPENGKKYSKKIICVETGQIFESINAAMREVKSSNIATALKNNTTAKGYHWSYL